METNSPMDSGRFLLAVVLMIALVVATNIIFPPRRGQPAATAADSVMAAADSALVEPVAVQPPPAQPESAAVTSPAEVLSAATTEVEAPVDSTVPGSPRADTVIAVSSLYRYAVTTAGAGVVLAELSGYESHAPSTAGEPVQLVPTTTPALIQYRLEIGDQVVDLSRLPFTPSTTGPIDVAAGEQNLTLAYADTSGSARIEFEYAFDPDHYLIDVRARLVSPIQETPRLLIEMGPTLRDNEADPAMDRATLAYVVRGDREGIVSQPFAKLDAQRTNEGPLDFVAIKSKYFVAAVVRGNEQAFGGVIATPTDVQTEATLEANLLPGSDGWFSFQLYLGPQEPEQLAQGGYNLRDVYVFGWKWLQPVLRPIGHAITWAVVGMHRVLGIGYGWVLIVFGILIRLVLWPLNATAMRSQLKTMELQPRLKDIQTRYKSDPQRLQKETLKLYKEEGFNPMGGCLPMLIPFPILITLFFVFQSTIEFRGVGFLWLPDLSMADPLFVLPVLLGISMFALQYLNYRAAPAGQQQTQMKIMMYVMPAFMTFLFLRFASGLNLYYASMNFASVPQQLQIIKERRRFHEAKKAKS